MMWKKEKYTFRSDASRAEFMRIIAIDAGEDTAHWFSSVMFPILITKIVPGRLHSTFHFTGANGQGFITGALRGHHRQYFKKVMNIPDVTKPEPVSGDVKGIESLESLIDSVMSFETIRVGGTKVKNAAELRNVLTRAKTRQVKMLESRGKILDKDFINLSNRIAENKSQLAALQ